MKKLLVALAILSLAGCGPMDDISTGKAFLKAFPDANVLMIQTPDLAAVAAGGGLKALKQPLVGERADLHDLSFYVAWQINHQAYHIVSTIWFITRFQPTVAVLEEGVLGEGEDILPYNARAVWGPFPDNEGKNLEFILHVWRGIDPDDGRVTFVYFAAGRTRGSDDDAWVPFVFGGAKPAVTINGVYQNDVGLVEVDCDAIRLLDPTEDDVGNASYYYEAGPDYHVVAAVGEGVWSDYTHTQTADATYFYGRSEEGYTIMEFAAEADVDAIAGQATESLQVTTGWLDNGDGRSDAAAAGGDLGACQAELTECWGRDLMQTYFHLIADGLDMEDGSVDACFTDQPIQLPDIDYETIRDLFNFNI